VELVRPHDAVNLVAAARLVQRRDARPEARDLEDQLGAVELQELEVARHLVVLPDVVGDRGPDVTLQVRVVRHPVSGARVQVHLLRLLLAVASALPREHRTLETCVPRRGACLVEPAVTVQEQRTRDLRHPVVQRGEDEQFVPEDVSLVGFSRPAARRHADVPADRVQRGGLQQVQHVQPQQHRKVQPEGLAGRLQMHVVATPQVFPGERVTREHGAEALGSFEPLARSDHRFGDRLVARRVQRDELLDHERLALLDGDVELLRDVAMFGHFAPRRCNDFAVDPRARARRLCDPELRLRSSYQQVDRVVREAPALERHQVPVVELPIQLHAVVHHAAVDGRAHRDGRRPVLGNELEFERCKMRMRHGDDPALLQRRSPFRVILEADVPTQHSPPQIELLTV